MANAFTEFLCGVGIAIACEGEPPSAVEPPAGNIDDGFYAVPAPPAPEPVIPTLTFEVPASLRLPAIETGTGTRQAQLPILNTGNGELSNLTVTVAGPGVFQVRGDCAVIANGATCPLQVVFAPQAAGSYAGEIMISAAGVVRRVGISAEAVAAAPPPPPESVVIVEQPAPATPPAPARDPWADFLQASAAQATRRMIGSRAWVVVPGPAGADQFGEGAESVEASWHLLEPDYAGEGRDGAFNRDLSTFPVERCRIIPQGSQIRMVLDHTINTQIGGPVKAHLDRDVYGSDGRLVLLPWGTWMLGSFEPLSRQGDTRVQVVWERAIRPDGSTIALSETAAADVMGRPGLVGNVDNRFWEKYGTVIATSAIATIVAFATADGSGDSDDGTASDELSAAGQALQQSLAQITADALRQNFNLAPRVTVPKGTVVYATPGDDWYFPNPFLVTQGASEPDRLTYDCAGEDFFRYRNGVASNPGG